MSEKRYSEAELLKKIDEVWIKEGSLGLPVLQGLKPKCCFEFVQHNGPDIGPWHFHNYEEKWKVETKPATPDKPPECRVHYHGHDVIDELAKGKTTEEMTGVYYADLVAKGKITVDILASFTKLTAKGYVAFAKKVGLLR